MSALREDCTARACVRIIGPSRVRVRGVYACEASSHAVTTLHHELKDGGHGAALSCFLRRWREGGRMRAGGAWLPRSSGTDTETTRNVRQTCSAPPAGIRTALPTSPALDLCSHLSRHRRMCSLCQRNPDLHHTDPPYAPPHTHNTKHRIGSFLVYREAYHTEAAPLAA